MAQKIKVGAVSYLNTKPLIYGFEQGKMRDEIDLVIDYPANIASMLVDNKIDIGLVPIATIPLLKEHYVVSDFGIGCDGEVATVCLFSDVPLKEITKILLDYQSRTSVELLKMLINEHWNIHPELIKGSTHYETLITGQTAGLIIGDRAFAQRQKNKYVYDLGHAWKEMTGLPFVFAAWISNKKLPDSFVAKFNAANEVGMNNIDKVIRQNRSADFNLNSYYADFVKFRLTPEMHMAAKLFISKLQGYPKPVL